MKRLAWALGWLGVLLALDWIVSHAFNPYIRQVVILCGINVILAVSLNLINGFTGQFSIGHAGFMAIGAYASAMFTLHAGARWVAALSAAGLPAEIAQGAALLVALLAGGTEAAVRTWTQPWPTWSENIAEV